VEEGSGSFDRDKTRLCPSCRMAISVLATKCRFCGENVGRPRVEDRHFTMDDLGTASPHIHKVSESVMNALEAFRAEEFSKEEAAPQEVRKSRSRRRSKSKTAKHDDVSGKAGEDSPDLEDGNDALSAAEPFSRVRSMTAARAAPAVRNKWVLLGKVVGVLVVVYFGGSFAAAKIRAYVDARNAQPAVTYHNQAVDILEGGGSTLAALQAAVDALAHVDNDENRKIADMVRKRVAEQARGLLNINPYRESNLDRASALVSQAAAIDGKSEVIQALKAEVDEEEFAYNKMSIAKLNPGAGTVTLRLIYPEKPTEVIQVVKKEGEKIYRGRFIVKQITDGYIRLEDAKRKDDYGLNRIVKLSRTGALR